jgi:uncharacterized membrane protein HdeD (DUF308 family)
MHPFLLRFSGLVLWRGIIFLLLGLLALCWPGMTFGFLIILLGFYMVVDGIVHIITSFSVIKQDKDWWVTLLRGIFGLLLGVLILMAPVATAIVLTWYLAAWLLMVGILEIIVAIRLRKKIQGEGWYIFNGIIALIAAIILMIHPLSSAVTLTLLAGIFAIVMGIYLIGVYIRLRRRHSKEHLHNP